MSWTRTVKIALAFVGLLVGAGFATGQEVIQYFISFGTTGLVGALISGLLMTAAGAVILQLGSYFLAREHNMVFSSVAHPVVARFLDISITVTLFAMGFVMLAGAGATVEQQLGLPTWVGALAMAVLVMVTGLLDVDKVSSIISGVTPLIAIAVVAGFVLTLMDLPGNVDQLSSQAAQTASAIEPWWLSAVNYTGLALILGVSMCLVIGGTTPNPREAGWGGFAGGALYTVLLLMACTILLLNFDEVGEAEVPMLALFADIHPVMGWVMVCIILLMIYNTAIGVLYALGRRLTASRPTLYRPVFLGTCLAAFAVSFAGFGTLMNVVYPILGYLGIVMVAVLCIWWLRQRSNIRRETGRRDSMRVLLTMKENDEHDYSRLHNERLEAIAAESVAEPEAITGAIELEVLRSLHQDQSAEANDDAAPAAGGAEGEPTGTGSSAR